jgi:hypothetical protein
MQIFSEDLELLTSKICLRKNKPLTLQKTKTSLMANKIFSNDESKKAEIVFNQSGRYIVTVTRCDTKEVIAKKDSFKLYCMAKKWADSQLNSLVTE